jgi:hypothetical protein
MALRILRETNSHIKSVILGQAAQLMMNMARAYAADAETLERYFYRYSAAWRREYLREKTSSADAYEAAYLRQRPKFGAYVTRVREVQRAESSDGAIPEEWFQHCNYMRKKILELYQAGDLLLGPMAQSEEEAVRRVFISYMHMHNNRLGVRIVDETYLAYVLSRAVRENLCQMV